MTELQIWMVLLVLLPTTTIGLAALNYYRTDENNAYSRNMYYLIGHFGLFTLHIITLKGNTSLLILCIRKYCIRFKIYCLFI